MVRMACPFRRSVRMIGPIPHRLKRIKNFLGYNYCSVDLPNELKCVEQALIKAQEQEKVLEILKIKDVLYTQIKNCESVDEYNNLIEFTDFDSLTQEEFDTVKRWAPGWKCNH